MMSFGSMFKSSSANTVGAGSASSSSVCPIPSNCSAVWESERSNGTDWSAANLTSQDPPRFEAALAKNPPTAAKANSSSTSASGSGSGHDSQASEEAWAVELHSGRWRVDTAYSRPTEAGKQSGSASEGWLYGKNFSQLDGRLQDESPNPRSAAVRRRRWLRLKQDESQRSGNSSSYSYSPSTTIFEEFDDGASEIAESLAESIQTTMTSASGADPTKRKSSASYFGHRRAKHAPEWDINFRVHDSTLSAIASEIKQLEKQCEAMEAENKKEWKDMVKASLETQIQYFEKACSQLTAQIEKDVSKGLSHVSAMEDDLRTVTDKLDEKKRALYFPTSRISMGQAGVYLAMDEYWIEHTSGQFVLQLVPDRLKPYAEIVLRGDTAPVSDQANATQAHASGAGISLRLKVENFRLAGDKGKNVPKLHIENMHLQLALNASLSLYFDADMKQWSCASKDLKLEIISLKGPYGVTKRYESQRLTFNYWSDVSF